MRRVVIAFFALTVAGARAGELKVGDVVITVDPQGCGFIDAVKFRGREVIKARPGFAGAQMSLVAAGDGTADSLFANRLAAMLMAKIAAATTEGGVLTARGDYTDGKISVPFVREFRPGSVNNSVIVREEVDFSRLPAGMLLARHSLDLPLVVCEDEHLRMFAFGGERRAEMYRMDMNDEPRRNQLISDNRAFWPYWDIGGVVQLADTYRIWRANHADTMAYPIEDGRGAPGWADYSELDWGLTAQMLDAAKSAPWALQIDARKGVFSILLHPPDQLPVSGTQRGKRTFAFQLVFHESSWPATHPCELDFELYKKLLDYLNRSDRYTHLDYVYGSVGIAVPEGPKSPAQMQEVYRRLILKERVQPSVVMRLLYRGDAWRMQGIINEVLKKSVPRNQPLEQWEQLAVEFFTKIKKDGLPDKPR